MTENARIRFRTKAGFTLLETLLYLSLFAIIESGLMLCAYIFFESNDRTAARAALSEDAAFALEKSAWLIRFAESVEAPISGTRGDALRVETAEGARAICRDGSRLRIVHGGAACHGGADLFSPGVAVARFDVGRYAGAAEHSRFMVSIALEAHTPQGKIVRYEATSTVDARL